MKRGILSFLVLVIAFHAPWRLAALVTETLMMPAGYVRLSDSNTKYWEALDLQHRLEVMGWTVKYDDELMTGSGVLGMTSFSTRTVYIDTSLSWNERYITMAHEAGHCMQPRRMSPNQAEAFAEAVSAILVGDSLREHARWLAGVKVDLILVAVADWSAIYRAADLLETK